MPEQLIHYWSTTYVNSGFSFYADASWNWGEVVHKNVSGLGAKKHQEKIRYSTPVVCNYKVPMAKKRVLALAEGTNQNGTQFL